MSRTLVTYLPLRDVSHPNVLAVVNNDLLDPLVTTTIMQSEEPLFDPSLKKKKKKKAVAFYEDPLGADADPTTPAPPLEDDEAPVTVHEQMKQSALENGDEAEKEKGEDDVKAMFGDIKKKKKKKEIPMDLVHIFYPLNVLRYLIADESLLAQGEEGSGTSTPAEGAATPDLDFSDLKKKKKKKEIPLDLGEDSGTSTPVAKESKEGEEGAAAPGEDLDFSDLKKKKKSSKKKAAEQFMRELGDVQDEDVDGAHLENIDERELGDDVFASGGGGGGGGGETEAEPWLGSDRDYLYPEVCFDTSLHTSKIN